jgi:hypothetical protein
MRLRRNERLHVQRSERCNPTHGSGLHVVGRCAALMLRSAVAPVKHAKNQVRDH